MRHVIRPKRFVGVCVLIALAFAGAHIVTQYYKFRIMPGVLARAQASPDWPTDPDLAERTAQNIRNPRGLIAMFDLDGEDNLPNTWSVLQLAIASLALYLLSGHSRSRGDKLHRSWFILAVVFSILSLDEGASMHNNLHIFSGTQKQRAARGIFYFSWVIPAGLATAAFGVSNLRFLWKLPPKTRWGMIITGIAYVMSAVGGEMVEGDWLARGNNHGVIFSALTLCEETGEMLSIAAFLYVLLDYAQQTNFFAEVVVPASTPPEAIHSTDRTADLVH